jgi:serine/threonine protein kinase
MGTVYLATDTKLNRAVAVKVPKLDKTTPELAEKALKRFHREAQAAAALAHPHVCHIYDVGEDDGVPFLAMEFIDGEQLAKQMRRPWPQRQAAALIAKVASGIAAAHAKGIVHRDLKPANIMLDAHGEPKVLDFGLAKRVDDDKLTRIGALLGTPQYMAKEQMVGETHKIGPWSDVYSLGVILYELLTARLPFDGHSAPHLLNRLLTTEAIKPREIRPDIDPALEAICLRGIGKELADRYASMTEFAAALCEYLGLDSQKSVNRSIENREPKTEKGRFPAAVGKKAGRSTELPVPPQILAPPPITAPAKCPWCDLELGQIESRRAEPIECGNCRNVWLLSDDGTRWNPVPKLPEPELDSAKPEPLAVNADSDAAPSVMHAAPVFELSLDRKSPATMKAESRSLEANDQPSDGIRSPATSTSSRPTISRRQLIGVSSATLLVVVVLSAITFRNNNHSTISPTEPALPDAVEDKDGFVRHGTNDKPHKIGADANTAISALLAKLKHADRYVR